MPEFAIPLAANDALSASSIDGGEVAFAEAILGNFCETLRTDDTPGPNDIQAGSGGEDDGPVYFTWTNGNDDGEIYKLEYSDFSVIAVRNNIGGDGDPRGVGGKSDVVWHVDRVKERVYELDTSDLSIIRNGDASFDPRGAGGNNSDLFTANQNNVDGNPRMRRRDPSDFSIIVNEPTPSGNEFVSYGMGGNSNHSWFFDGGTGDTYELAPSDLSIVQQCNPGPTDPRGCGGDEKSIFLTGSENGADRLQEDATGYG